MKLTKVSSGDIVKVLWVDITSDNLWMDSERAQSYEPHECLYVGIVLNMTKEYLRCTNMIALPDKQCDCTVFPIGVIKVIEILESANAKNTE